ncbi:MAG: c-type cytochrome [Bdellovibrionales bacterium]|nr:c-type cytochrome [Bdellovibrionales bacterium]
MSAKEKRIEEVKSTGHVYDGIEELDHPPPPWFVAMFYLTVAIGLAYYAYYEIGPGPTQGQELQAERRKEELAELTSLAASGGSKIPSEDELQAMGKDPGRRSAGAAVFSTKCASCHGNRGEGGIGPNLTDRHWIHGGRLTDVFNVITQGVPVKGMPPWGALLKQEEVEGVTAFVASLAGTNPPGGKAPQGELVEKR